MHATTADAATARVSAVSARSSSRSSSSSSASGGRRSSSADTVTRDSWTFRSTVGASLVASDCDDDGNDDNENDATSEDDGSAATVSPRRDWYMGERPVDASTKKLKLQAIPGFSNNEALKAHLPARRNAPASLPRRGQWTSKQQAIGDTKDRLAVKKQQQQQQERPAHPLYALSDDALGRGKKSLEHKIAMHEELTAIERKRLQTTPDALDASFNAVVGRPRPIVHYHMSTRLVYVLVFASAAALHCGVFNFSREVRRLLRLETTPFGVFLLLCWALVGLLSFAGGWLGDLVHDRVVLLRRGAALWATSVVLLHVAAFQAGSTLSLVLLALALPGACLSHALFAPNCVVLGADTTDRRHSRPSPARRPAEALASPDSDDAASKCERDEQQHHTSSDVDARQSAARTLAVHTYFSRCFGAALAGSSSVQLFFFLLIDVGARVSRQGFLCMLLSSLLLLGALVVFLFQSRTHFQPPRVPDNSFAQKLARHEKQLQDDDDDDAFAWRAVLRVFTRAVVGGVGLAALLVALVGVCVALVALLVVPDASFHTRLAAFLMILLGWHAVLSISKLQLRASSQLATKSRSLGVPVRQLESALLLVFFACMSSLSAFLRAQLYTTLVVQLCQTRLALPGADRVLVHPDALGALVSVVSLLSLPLSTATRCRKSRQRRVPSISPSRRLSIGVCLALLGVFLSSVVELYRRTNAIVAFPQLACNKAHSDFGVLWTAPHLVLLGLSDAVFRVSLQEQLHSLRILSSRWPGFVRGVIDLSDMVGYVGALALTSMLSTWLFRPTTSDLALVLLLMTTLLAFAYASLKRVAERIAAGHVQTGVSGG